MADPVDQGGPEDFYEGLDDLFTLEAGRTTQASENDNLQNDLNELEEEYKIQFGIFSQESARQEKYEATIPAEKTLVVLEMFKNNLSLLTTEKKLKKKELSCFQEIEYLKKDVAEHVKEQIKLKQNFRMRSCC